MGLKVKGPALEVRRRSFSHVSFRNQIQLISLG